MSIIKLIPFIYWAQDSSNIYLKIDINDITERNVEIDEEKIKVKLDVVNRNEVYEFKLNFNNKIKKDDSKYYYNERGIFITLVKEETNYWERLTKDKSELKNHIKINWDLWKDEDNEENNEENNMFDMDYMKMMESMGMNNMDMMNNINEEEEYEEEEEEDNNEDEEEYDDNEDEEEYNEEEYNEDGYEETKTNYNNIVWNKREEEKDELDYSKLEKIEIE